MNNKIAKTTAALSLALMTFSSAHAMPIEIDGAISFNGDTTLDSPFATATGFLSFDNIEVGNNSDGDYSGVPEGTAVTMNGFQFTPDLSPSPVSPLWEFSYNSLNYSFSLNEVTSVTQTANFLAVSGIGMASITGFLDTEKKFVITTQGDSVTTNPTISSITFSTPERTSVPDGGATIGMLGAVVLFGSVALRRLRK